MDMTAKTIFLGLLLWAYAADSSADSYYTANAYTPYPPGCVTLPAKQLELYGDNIVRFWSGSLWLEVVYKIDSPDEYKNLGLVEMDMYRIGCAETNRSVILIEFRLPLEWADPRNSQLVLPTFAGVTGFDSVVFDLKEEPNGWSHDLQQHALTKRAIGDYTNGWWDVRGATWTYVLDMGPIAQYWSGDFLTEYYNDQFGLAIYTSNSWSDTSFLVPATRELLQPSPTLPLNGRLSGSWVDKNASDQGVLLSFGSPVSPPGTTIADPVDSSLNVFLSWYTFGPEGDLLWLTGAGRFPQGATEVSFPVEQVAQGQFLGSREAERAVVGNVRLIPRQQ